jgi:hypothetical protein
MRSCPQCGQALTLDDIRCPSCRISTRPPDAGASSTPTTNPGRGSEQAPPNQSLRSDGSQPLYAEPLGRTKTLLGHRSVPPNSNEPTNGGGTPGAVDTLERGWTPAPYNANDSRIEPAPMVTVLGVPIPRAPNSRPSYPIGTWQPSMEPGSTGNVPTDASQATQKPIENTPSYGQEQSPRVIGPSTRPITPQETTQTLQGFRSIDIEPDAHAKESSGSKRLRPSGRPVPWPTDSPDGYVASRATTNVRQRDPGTIDDDAVKDQPGIPSPKLLNAQNQSSAPATGKGSVHPRSLNAQPPDVESLFYYLDSQVLGLPPPSRIGNATQSSSPPASVRSNAPPGSKRPSRKVEAIRAIRRRQILVAIVAVVAAIAVLALSQLHRNPSKSSMPQPPSRSSIK